MALPVAALTRGREKATIVGQAYMFERGCKTKDETKRKTVISMLAPPAEASPSAAAAERT